jgi:hypothetical protein
LSGFVVFDRTEIELKDPYANLGALNDKPFSAAALSVDYVLRLRRMGSSSATAYRGDRLQLQASFMGLTSVTEPGLEREQFARVMKRITKGS